MHHKKESHKVGHKAKTASHRGSLSHSRKSDLGMHKPTREEKRNIGMGGPKKHHGAKAAMEKMGLTKKHHSKQAPAKHHSRGK